MGARLSGTRGRTDLRPCRNYSSAVDFRRRDITTLNSTSDELPGEECVDGSGGRSRRPDRASAGLRRVLDLLSCRMESGRITGLLGPSGAGKSTLIRCIVGVQRIRGGAVTVLGRTGRVRSIRRRLGYVTQAAVGLPRSDGAGERLLLRRPRRRRR